MSVGRAELVRLFAGDLDDDLWAPHHSFRLARAICTNFAPTTIEELVTVVYGAIPGDEIPTLALESLTRALQAHLEGEKRRKRRKEKV